MGWLVEKQKERFRRALERQLEYQELKAERLGDAVESMHSLFVRSQTVRRMIESVKSIADTDKILEVGSGAHGLIFGFANKVRVGVDPLAVDYKRLFPKWQENAATAAAMGEQLPFADESFDVVMSDNVIDHAEQPLKIVDEIVRVLKPAGLLYFTVNVHHPFYDAASYVHGLWNAVGLKFELSPFADHTVHLSESQMRSIFAKLPLMIVKQGSTVAETKKAQRTSRLKNPDALLKKLFYKNALYEVLAIKS
jgi:ubiquinone/menaquinone biosynthesis C-methylase UbiE